MSRYKGQLYHVIRLNLKKNPDIAPWLHNQRSIAMSIAQLIRLAQAIGGNQDWLKVAPMIEAQLVTRTRYVRTKSSGNVNPKSSVSPNNTATRGSYTQRGRKNEFTGKSNQSSASAKPHLNFKDNGLDGF